MSRAEHILLIRFSALGDVAMTVPVIRAFQSQYPTKKITVLTKPSFIPIFKNLENVNVLAADVKGKHNGLVGLFKLSREISKLKIDSVGDLHNVLRTKILKLFLFDIHFEHIDKGREEKKLLVSGETFHQLKTTSQRYADVFTKLGFPIDLHKPSFPKRATLNPETLNYIGRGTKKWIGMAPFAAHKGKMYPLDLMESVIRSLSKNNRIILFGGGKREGGILNNLSAKYENVINVANKYDLGEEIDIISNLDVMLSMDSGNAHLAAMLGIEVVTLWGVTHPYAGFYPFNQDINNALLSDRKKYPKIPTSIYGNDLPKGYEEVMRTIAPSQVVEKVRNLLQ